MKCPPLSSPLFCVVILLNRLSLGLFFALAGWHKIMAEGGVQGFVEGFYKVVTPSWLPGFVATPFGYALPYIELIAGAMLVIGLFGRIAAIAIAFLLISISIALLGAGEFFSGPGPFHTNVILLTLSLVLVMTGSRGISIDAKLFKSCCGGEPGDACCT